MAIFIIIVILLIIFYVKRENALEEDRRARERKRKYELEAAEKQREEERKYEIVYVVKAYLNDLGKPTAVVRRSNNTYCYIERSETFVINKELKLPRESTKNWTWLSDQEYKKKEEQKKGQQVILEKEKKKDDRINQTLSNIDLLHNKMRLYVILQPASKYKPNWQDFMTVLKEARITKLYHFTDRSNIPSIKSNGGLYSWWAAEKNNITISRPGGIGIGRQLDTRKGLQNYVRLSFNKNNPMLYVAQKEKRILQPVFLEIDPIVILDSKTLFTKENAAKNGVYPDSTLDFFRQIVIVDENNHMADLISLLGSNFLINSKAEILVFEKIPLEYITNINQF